MHKSAILSGSLDVWSPIISRNISAVKGMLGSHNSFLQSLMPDSTQLHLGVKGHTRFDSILESASVWPIHSCGIFSWISSSPCRM